LSQIPKEKRLVLRFDEVGREDTALVGGKCANLGEMITKARVPVPNGFAVTAHAYRFFLEKSGIRERILSLLSGLDVRDLKQLNDRTSQIREIIQTADLPRELIEEVSSYYSRLKEEEGKSDVLVAVRSSATAEDLPGANFAGQQETYLNVKGIEELISSIKKCFASLFTPRATVYREEKGFKHDKVYLSVAVQKMIPAKASGVMFSLHPVTGDKKVVVIEASWGLGEFVVQGRITPDEYVIAKSDLKIISKKISDKQTMLLAIPEGGTEEKQVPTEQQKVQCLNDE